MCRYFEEIKHGVDGVVRTFYEDYRLPVPPPSASELESVNASLSAPALTITAFADTVLEQQADRFAVRKFLKQRLPTAVYGRPQLLNAEQRSALLDRLCPENIDLHERFVTSPLETSPYVVL